MKRMGSRTQELLLEMLVGAFMFAVLIGLAVFTIILSRENYLATTYPMEVIFEDVMGLRDGDNVVIRGMTVGKVKALTLADDGVHVIAALERPLQLKEDYTVRVISTSVLGGRYLQVDEGRTGAALPDDTLLRGETPLDMMMMAADVVADFRDITAKIRAGEGTLGKLVTDDTLYNDARGLVAQLKQASGDGGFLTKLDGVADELADIAAKINRGDGTLGKLVNEDGLYEETMATLGEARKTLDDVRETSPLVTFTSILFGAL